MKKQRILGLFSDFDKAISVIVDIRQYRLPGVSVDDITIKSPIEHPEIEEILGERPCYVPWFTLAGALFGLVFGAFFLSAAQANFLVQPQGGKPVITTMTNLVLIYEMLILFAMLATSLGFLIGGRFMRRRSSLYDTKISLDQVGIEIETDNDYIEPVRKLFTKHMALEIREGKP
ncbi:MAG: quinol:electron acceptor oxidoreductase subunit ActD [Rhodospirillales bacterium]